MLRSIGELEADYNAAVDRLDTFKKRAESDAEIDDAFRAEWDEALWSCNRLQTELEDTRAAVRARAQHQPVSTRTVPAADGSGMLRMSISEPDRYEKRGRSFFHDVYRSRILGDVVATQRLTEHQEYELEKRSMTSSTFGGLIPPNYLLDMVALAPRAGRKFIDAVNHRDLPETGMQLIVPRLTQGTAAASQSAENQTVATQDMAETDLTINVRTVAGYVPTSRQSLERAQYDEELIFGDLTARVWTALDSDAINADGTSGTVLGVLHTSGTEIVPLPAWSIQDLWGALADAQARIADNVGGLGLEATTVVMSPRRWGAIASSLDAQDRPLLLPNGSPAFNAMGRGAAGGYGPVGQLFGLDVVTSSNIPTTANYGGGGAVEDVIIVMASDAVHVWEPQQGVVTVAMEQIAGDQLTVHCVAYEYAAFSAGRYPGAVAVIEGAGLSTPDYGVRAS